MGSYVDICPGNATGANRVAGKKRLTVLQPRVNYYAGKPKKKKNDLSLIQGNYVIWYDRVVSKDFGLERSKKGRENGIHEKSAQF